MRKLDVILRICRRLRRARATVLAPLFIAEGADGATGLVLAAASSPSPSPPLCATEPARRLKSAFFYGAG